MASQQKLTFARVRDTVVYSMIACVCWFGGQYILDRNAGILERLEPIPIVVHDDDASVTDITIRGMTASMNNFAYHYEVDGQRYEGEDSLMGRLSVDDTVIDGQEVLVATGYYDPAEPSRSYLEKKAADGDTVLYYAKWGLTIFFGLGAFATLIDLQH